MDPIKCEAHGLCAELLPERITLDDWGYPVIEQRPVPRELEDLARRTISACPTLALRLRATESGARPVNRRDRPYQVYRQSRFSRPGPAA